MWWTGISICAPKDTIVKVLACITHYIILPALFLIEIGIITQQDLMYTEFVKINVSIPLNFIIFTLISIPAFRLLTMWAFLVISASVGFLSGPVLRK